MWSLQKNIKIRNFVFGAEYSGLDESAIEVYQNRKVRVWKLKNQKFKPEFMTGTVKHYKKNYSMEMF